MLRKVLKHGLIAIASLVLGCIAGVIGAVMTWPFWGWFEKTTGIESLGHSGPADWVFAFMMGLATVAILIALEWGLREKAMPDTSSRAV